MIIAKINNATQSRCELNSHGNYNSNAYPNLKPLKQDTVSFGSAQGTVLKISEANASKLRAIAQRFDDGKTLPSFKRFLDKHDLYYIKEDSADIHFRKTRIDETSRLTISLETEGEIPKGINIECNYYEDEMKTIKGLLTAKSGYTDLETTTLDAGFTVDRLNSILDGLNLKGFLNAPEVK